MTGQSKTSIFVDAHVLDRGFEGAATFIHGIYTELARQNPDSYRVFLGCRDPERVMSLFPSGSSFLPIKYSSHNSYIRLLYDIPNAIRKINPDWAHFTYFTPLSKRCRWVVTIHDVLFNDFRNYFPLRYRLLRNILFPASAYRADLLTTISSYSRSRISHWYGIDINRIALIPCGINSQPTINVVAQSEQVAEVLEHQGGYILCVSRFEPRKNQLCLLNAFLEGHFWRRGLKLVFVGSRTLATPDFDRQFAQVPNEAVGAIEFLSDVPAGDLQLLYANARVAVYPSFGEGFGMPPLESAQYGTPTLCADTTAMMEYEFLSYFHFDPYDSGNLRAVLEQIIESPTEAKYMAMQAARTIRERYSWDRAARLFHECLLK